MAHVAKRSNTRALRGHLDLVSRSFYDFVKSLDTWERQKSEGRDMTNEEDRKI